MTLILEDDDGNQYNVIIDIEDYLNDPKTIVKQVKLAYQYALKKQGGPLLRDM